MEKDFDLARRWPQRKTKRLCVSIDEKIHDRFKKFLDDGGYDTSKYMEVLLEKFFKAMDSESEEKSDQ